MRHGQLMNYSLPAILFNLFLLSMHSKQLFVLYSIFLYGFFLFLISICVCFFLLVGFSFHHGCIYELMLKWNSILPICFWKIYEILRFISSFRLWVMDINNIRRMSKEKKHIQICMAIVRTLGRIQIKKKKQKTKSPYSHWITVASLNLRT